MSDPLSLLREHIINKKPVSHDDTHIITGDLKFPRNVLTAYKQDRGRGDPYSLEAIYYLLQKPHLAGAAKTRLYAEECKVHNFQRVLLADQKDVLAYMTGKQETSQYLVSVEELTAIAVPQSQEVPAAAKAAEKPEKRKREEVTLDMADEKTVESKKALGERIATLAVKPIEGPEEKKKARLPVMLGDKADEIKRTDSPYILADEGITRSILEKERIHMSRTTCLHTTNGKDFKHLHEILRGAIASRKSGKFKVMCAPSNSALSLWAFSDSSMLHLQQRARRQHHPPATAQTMLRSLLPEDATVTTCQVSKLSRQQVWTQTSCGRSNKGRRCSLRRRTSKAAPPAKATATQACRASACHWASPSLSCPKLRLPSSQSGMSSCCLKRCVPPLLALRALPSPCVCVNVFV